MIDAKEKLKSVFFYPWVGKNYEKGINGKKILVLGESHICGCIKCSEGECGNLQINDEGCREFTTNTLETFLNYQKGTAPDTYDRWMNTFSKFTKEFYDWQLNDGTLFDFWNSVIFYNYVQYSTAKARISPKEDEFGNSEDAFFEVIAKYKPDLVIAWGRRLWERLPSVGFYKDMLESSIINEGKGLYYYKVENAEIPIMFVLHPSAHGFCHSAYKPIHEAVNM